MKEDLVALAIYSVKRVGARIVDIDFNQVLKLALKLAPLLKPRTLDLLHISACKIIGAEAFATFDKEIIARKDAIEKIGIKVLTKM